MSAVYLCIVLFSTELKYALIGVGIGLLLAVGFFLVKACIIRKHVRDNSRGELMEQVVTLQLFTIVICSPNNTVSPPPLFQC